MDAVSARDDGRPLLRQEARHDRAVRLQQRTVVGRSKQLQRHRAPADEFLQVPRIGAEQLGDVRQVGVETAVDGVRGIERRPRWVVTENCCDLGLAVDPGASDRAVNFLGDLLEFLRADGAGGASTTTAAA